MVLDVVLVVTTSSCNALSLFFVHVEKEGEKVATVAYDVTVTAIKKKVVQRLRLLFH